MSSRGVSMISPRLVLGLVIMVLGTLFLLDNLDIVAFDSAVRWWPLAPIAVGLTMALQPAGAGSRGFGFFLVALGVWALLDELDIVSIDFGDVFPVALIVLGGWLIWRAVADPGETVRGSHAAGPPRSAAAGPAFDRTTAGRPPGDPGISDADTLSAFAFAGHVQKASASRNFQGADLTVIMGGCNIDLRNADIGPEAAVIDAFAFWGGIEILVPTDWVVTNKVLPLLGGSEDATRPVPGASKQLLVRGTAMMGGVEIANEKSDE